MKIEKLILFGLIIFSMATFVYSAGYYDNSGEYTYYTFNNNPQINITIQAPAKFLLISKATLSLEEQDYIYFISESENKMDPFEKKTFNFYLDYFNIGELSNQEKTYFKLAVTDRDGDVVKTSGDPTNFKLKLDNIIPQLNSPNSEVYLTYEDSNLELYFSEKISEYSILVNDIEIENFVGKSKFEKDYSSIINYNFGDGKLSEGVNNVTIFFKDFAGNENSKSFNINYLGEPLYIELITSAQDSSLKYFYDSEYPEFFEKTIYSSVREYDLMIKTNKPAKCYYSTNLNSHGNFNEVTNKEDFETSNNLKHIMKVKLDNFDKLWVACQNKAYSQDIVYLNKFLGFENNLILLKHQVSNNFEISSILPETIVTYSPFDITLTTNEKSVCSFNVDSSDKKELASNNFLTHNFDSLSLDNKKYSLNFICFNHLGEIIKKIHPLTVDTNSGVKITDYSPKYVSSSSASIKMSLSEDVECRFSNKQEKVSDYNTLKNISGSSLSRTFSVNGLVKGENKIFIYCQKGININENLLKIIYDQDGPQLSNLSFVNNGIKSDFISSTDKISYELNVDSLVPISKFYVTISGGQEEFNDIVSSNEVTLKGDFESATKISIIAENELKRNSSKIEKAIKFDLMPPSVSFSNLGENVKVICIDTDSSCEKIFYGLSDVSFNCNPSIKYGGNESIKIADNNYICAKAFDMVGHLGTAQTTPLFKGYGSSGNLDTNNSFENNSLGNESVINDDLENNSINKIDDPFEQDPYNPSDDSGVNYLLVAALVFILSGIGGGGYYAYQKGYLDEQLKKFGIVKNSSSNSSKKQTQFTTSQPKNANIKSKEISKSKYDEHLSRLNKFVDDTLNSKNEVFENFKDDGKGKVKGYDDTLFKGKRKSKVAKEDFDEFYSSSKNTSNNLNSTDVGVEKEAEAFEKFYNEKKEKSESKTKTNKK